MAASSGSRYRQVLGATETNGMIYEISQCGHESVVVESTKNRQMSVYPVAALMNVGGVLYSNTSADTPLGGLARMDGTFYRTTSKGGEVWRRDHLFIRSLIALGGC